MHLFKEILMNHYHMYPLMQIQDFIKLIYQMVYGPKHFSNNPSLEQIILYLKSELLVLEDNKSDEYIEDIGNGYVRIYLNHSFNHEGKLNWIAVTFYESMMLELENPEQLKNLFLSAIDDFLNLVKSNDIKLDEANCRLWLDTYLEQGIRAISHSETYRNTYKPHYRVVHQSKFSK
ncbi:MAG: hypothetical protein K9L02_04345 [Acholeplasmataceae bacterium]|nr:hypothetical protein [Acholeplasmataceae bacterium]